MAKTNIIKVSLLGTNITSDMLEVGAVVSLGKQGQDTVASPYLVTSISPQAQGYSLELLPYDERIYETGEIGEFHSNITQRPVSNNAPIPQKSLDLNDVVSLIQKMTGQTATGDTPSIVENALFVAKKDGFDVSFSLNQGQKNNQIALAEYKIYKGSADTPVLSSCVQKTSMQYFYSFDRASTKDGYPEKEDVLQYRLKIRVQNIQGVWGEWSGEFAPDVSNYGTWLLPPPQSVGAATKGALTLSSAFTLQENCFNQVLKVVFLLNTGGDTQEIRVAPYSSYIHKLEGFLEREDIEAFSLQCKLVGLTGESSLEEGVIDTSRYGTWKIPKFSLSKRVQGRGATLFMMPFATEREQYSTLLFKVRIKRTQSQRTGHEEDPAPDSTFFKPLVAFPQGQSPYTSVDNYKDTSTGDTGDTSTGEDFVSTSSPFSQTLPLLGQNDTQTKEDGSVVSAPIPRDTEYTYQVQIYSKETGEERTDAGYLQETVAQALATQATDLALAAVNTAQIADGSITTGKLVALEIVAGKTFTGGIFSDGIIENTKNYWALNDVLDSLGQVVFEQGDFRVGDENSYLMFKKRTGQFLLKLSTFLLEGINSIVNGVFVVQKNNKKTQGDGASGSAPLLMCNPQEKDITVDNSQTQEAFNIPRRTVVCKGMLYIWGQNYQTADITDGNPKIVFADADQNQKVALQYNAHDAYRRPAGLIVRGQADNFPDETYFESPILIAGNKASVGAGGISVQGNADIAANASVGGTLAAGRLFGRVQASSLEKDYTCIDLSGSQYDQNTWYFVTTGLDTREYAQIECATSIYMGSVPSWGAPYQGFCVQLRITTLGHEWGMNDLFNTDVWYAQWSLKDNSQFPVCYHQMGNSSTAVIWLRGGGKYYLWSSLGRGFLLHTSAYTVGEETTNLLTSSPSSFYQRCYPERATLHYQGATTFCNTITAPSVNTPAIYNANGISIQTEENKPILIASKEYSSNGEHCGIKINEEGENGVIIFGNSDSGAILKVQCEDDSLNTLFSVSRYGNVACTGSFSCGPLSCGSLSCGSLSCSSLASGLRQAIIDAVYPVGFTFLSGNTDPATWFPGTTWEYRAIYGTIASEHAGKIYIMGWVRTA